MIKTLLGAALASTLANFGATKTIGQCGTSKKCKLSIQNIDPGSGVYVEDALGNKLFRKIVDAESNAKLYLQNINEDITATITSDNSEGDGEKMRFNPEVGYITPYGTVKEDNAGEYMDITM